MFGYVQDQECDI
jgi:hypothetical protein